MRSDSCRLRQAEQPEEERLDDGARAGPGGPIAGAFALAILAFVGSAPLALWRSGNAWGILTSRVFARVFLVYGVSGPRWLESGAARYLRNPRRLRIAA